MGVSGSGKTFFGRTLAANLGREFLDGDDFHPAANREKMQAGWPLTDEDRQPWLERLNAELRARADRHDDRRAAVLACSALKTAYRTTLRTGLPGLRFVFLRVDAATVRGRVHDRAGHFFPESLVQTQFTALEPPVAGEAGSDPATLLVLDATRPSEENVRRVREFLREGGHVPVSGTAAVDDVVPARETTPAHRGR